MSVGQQSGSQRQEPWRPQQPYLQDIMSQAQNFFYGGGFAPNPYQQSQAPGLAPRPGMQQPMPVAGGRGGGGGSAWDTGGFQLSPNIPGLMTAQGAPGTQPAKDMSQRLAEARGGLPVTTMPINTPGAPGTQFGQPGMPQQTGVGQDPYAQMGQRGASAAFNQLAFAPQNNPYMMGAGAMQGLMQGPYANPYLQAGMAAYGDIAQPYNPYMAPGMQAVGGLQRAAVNDPYQALSLGAAGGAMQQAMGADPYAGLSQQAAGRLLSAPTGGDPLSASIARQMALGNPYAGVSQQAAGQTLAGALNNPFASGAQAALGTLTGAADVNQNPYLQGAINAAIRPLAQTYQDITAPGLNLQAVASGQTRDASRNQIAQGIAQRELLQQAGDIAARMGSQAYGQGLTAAGQAAGLGAQTRAQDLGALQGLTNLGLTAQGQNLGALTALSGQGVQQAGQGLNALANLTGLGLQSQGQRLGTLGGLAGLGTTTRAQNIGALSDVAGLGGQAYGQGLGAQGQAANIGAGMYGDLLRDYTNRLLGAADIGAGTYGTGLSAAGQALALNPFGATPWDQLARYAELVGAPISGGRSSSSGVNLGFSM